MKNQLFTALTLGCLTASVSIEETQASTTVNVPPQAPPSAYKVQPLSYTLQRVGNQKLIDAIKRKDKEEVDALIKQGVNANFHDPDVMKVPLAQALLSNDLHIVGALMQAGAKVTAPIFQIYLKNSPNINIIKLLFSSKLKFKKQEEGEILSFLIYHPKFYQDNQMLSLLDIFIDEARNKGFGYVSISDYPISFFVDIVLKTIKISEEKSLAILKKMNALIKLQPDNIKLVSSSDIDDALEMTIRGNLAKIQAFLIENFVQPGMDLPNSLTASVMKGEASYIDLLAKKGADVNIPYKKILLPQYGPHNGEIKKWTQTIDLGRIIHLAAEQGCIACVKSLHQHVNLDEKDGRNDNTPLYRALLNPVLPDKSKLEMIDMLISLGANPASKNKTGLTPLEYLQQKPNTIKDQAVRESIEKKLSKK